MLKDPDVDTVRAPLEATDPVPETSLTIPPVILDEPDEIATSPPAPTSEAPATKLRLPEELLDTPVRNNKPPELPSKESPEDTPISPDTPSRPALGVITEMRPLEVIVPVPDLT